MELTNKYTVGERVYFKDGELHAKPGTFTMIMSGTVTDVLTVFDKAQPGDLVLKLSNVRLHLMELSDPGFGLGDIDLLHRSLESNRFTVRKNQILEGL